MVVERDVEEKDIRLHQLTLTLQRIDRYINLLNVKASLVLPADAIVLSYLLTERRAFLALLRDSSLSWINTPLYLLSLSAILVSAIYSLKVLMAFLKTGSLPGEYHSILFFGSIAEMSLEAYMKRQIGLTQQEFSEDLARQIHLLSQNLQSKYKSINFSLIFLFVGAGLPTLVIMLSSLS